MSHEVCTTLWLLSWSASKPCRGETTRLRQCSAMTPEYVLSVGGSVGLRAEPDKALGRARCSHCQGTARSQTGALWAKRSAGPHRAVSMSASWTAPSRCATRRDRWFSGWMREIKRVNPSSRNA